VDEVWLTVEPPDKVAADMTEGGTSTVTLAKNAIRKGKNVDFWDRGIFHPSLQG
jgi:hypothetical protein